MQVPPPAGPLDPPDPPVRPDPPPEPALPEGSDPAGPDLPLDSDPATLASEGSDLVGVDAPIVVAEVVDIVVIETPTSTTVDVLEIVVTEPPPRRARSRLVFGATALVAVVALGVLAGTAVQGDPTAPAPTPAPTTAIASAPAPGHPPGALLSNAPDALELEVPPPPSIDGIRAHLEAGDAERALRTAIAASRTLKGRDRDAALMVVGMIDKERDRHNLASEAFAGIAQGDGPLASLATYEQAEQDQLRGQNPTAIQECERYRQKWPAGAHAGDCLRIEALANVALGNLDKARAAAAAYDADHPTGRISEQIALAVAEKVAQTDPAASIPLFQQLAITHSAALAGRVAEEKLAALKAAGLAAAKIPEDDDSRMTRALSLRESGRRDDAWALFDQLRKSKDPKVQQWVEDQYESFGWDCQRWDFLAERYAADFAKSQDPDVAWKRYRVLARAAKYDEAATLALSMEKKAPNAGHWRRNEDEVGRTLMLARRYPEAREQFDIVADRGGWTGRRAEFSAAFASYMSGDLQDAVDRFTRLIAADQSAVLEARYWRAAAYAKLGKTAEADADRAWIVSTEPWSWYAALIHQSDPTRPTVAPYARVGRWIGTVPLTDPGPSVLELPVVDAELATPERAKATEASWSGKKGLPDPVAVADPPPDPSFAAWTVGSVHARPPDQVSPPGRTDWEEEPPSSYRPSSLFDPAQSRSALARFASDFGKRWPELEAASDLASVGLYDLSGPMLNDWFESWRVLVRKRDATAKKLTGTSPEAWRQLFLAARDHNNTARYGWGMWETLTDPAEIEEAWRLDYPLAHDRYVWTHARLHDLDPYLVLGLMRQESTYNATARSRVGARGAMQIMPQTGHLLANLVHDTSFDAGDLEDPTVAVGYGIRYLGLLMDRFGGVFPLAVASYNSGPFAVAGWLHGTEKDGKTLPLDELVEHIPYKETRDYVKKVTEGYSAYVSLYAPEGSALGIPLQPNGDRPEIVDF